MATAIVIGADRGIGAALVDVYAGRGGDAIARIEKFIAENPGRSSPFHMPT